MIPKTIHCCWFGKGEMPEMAAKCMDSWRRYCPDFEIRLWNESNFDVNVNRYSMEAAKANQWVFVSYIARLWAVYNHGGVYLDVDVELIKPIDRFLSEQMFLCFENRYEVNMGSGFGAEKNFHLLRKMLDLYDASPFIKADNTINRIASSEYATASTESEGFLPNGTKQTINNATLYPTEYFCPKDWWTGEMNITENTHSIHHFLASWLGASHEKNRAA